MAVPPTVREPAKGGLRGLLIAVVALLVAGGAAVGLYFYFRVLDYVPLAHRHVPAGSNIVLRADGPKIVLFKPMRDHLWPLLLEGQDEKQGEGRRLRLIEEKTGVKLPLHLREVIIASLDAASWVVVLGGTFPAGRFVAGMAEVLRAEGVKGWSLDGDLLVSERGPALGQADDGTIVLGTTRQIAQTALPVSDDGSPVPGPITGEALSFLVNQRAYQGAVSLLPPDLPGLDSLSQVEQVTGTMTLSEQPQLLLEVQPKDGTDAAELGRRLERFFVGLRAAAKLESGQLGGAKAALDAAAVEVDGKVVRITAPWPYEPLDRAVKQLADALRSGEKLGSADRSEKLRPF